MSRYITGFSVSKNQDEEKQLEAKGFVKKDPTDADAKQVKLGNAVNFWHKYNEREDEPPLTRAQISYNDEMVQGLKDAGYTEGSTFPTTGGDVTLWSFYGTIPYDIPIVNTFPSHNAEEEAQLITMGLQRVYSNRIEIWAGTYIKLWVEREKPTFIQDVTATSSYNNDVDLFNKGYIRMDYPTNTIPGGLKGSNFLWYRLTTDPSDSITDLKISINPEEYQQYKEEGYQLVNVNLNNGAGGKEVYLWYKRGQGKPVKSMTLFCKQSDIPIFEEYGIQVIEKNINEGNKGERFLCFWQE